MSVHFIEIHSEELNLLIALLEADEKDQALYILREHKRLFDEIKNELLLREKNDGQSFTSDSPISNACDHPIALE